MTLAMRTSWNRMANALETWISMDFVLVASRFGIASIFFYSGRTKVEGLLHVTDGAVALFRYEYHLPLIDPWVAAHAAAYAEHLFPLLLAIGLGTRLSALALLAMTLVIEIFVYPDAWPTHLSWAGLLLLLTVRGGGRWSVDSLLKIR